MTASTCAPVVAHGDDEPDCVTRLYHVIEPPPLTPPASSLCSSSCQGQGRTSSMATASMCLEDDELWDNVPRPPSLSYCVTASARTMSLIDRRHQPSATSSPAAPLHHNAALNTVCSARLTPIV